METVGWSSRWILSTLKDAQEETNHFWRVYLCIYLLCFFSMFIPKLYLCFFNLSLTATSSLLVCSVVIFLHYSLYVQLRSLQPAARCVISVSNRGTTSNYSGRYLGWKSGQENKLTIALAIVVLQGVPNQCSTRILHIHFLSSLRLAFLLSLGYFFSPTQLNLHQCSRLNNHSQTYQRFFKSTVFIPL